MTRRYGVPIGFARLRSFVLLVAAAASAPAIAPSPAIGAVGQAVEVPQSLSGPSSNEMLRRLLASGLTRSEVRSRLRQMGFDPFLIDPYFAAVFEGRNISGQAMDNATLDAFQGLGLIGSDSTVAVIQRPPLADSVEADDDLPRVFGRRVFRQTTSRFDPLLAGPVGDDYVLGPGDRITLILTGNVEVVREQLVVSREGFLVIPDVGQVPVVGLTMEELRERLFTRLRRVYSGISRNPDADTFFSVSISRLRTIQVRVLGEVVRPGAYQLSSVATVLEALYFAGGPTDQGTYRRVLLRRGRDVPIEVDLYPYLTSGSLSEDHRLQAGDVVYVPEAGRQATIQGEVRRPAIFELAADEGLEDLVRLAGGLLPTADASRAQVNRILPPAYRSPEMHRVLVDAPLAAVMEGTEHFDLVPGDEVVVGSVSDVVRRRVEARGAFWQPGSYELDTGMTLDSLVERAGGLLPDVHVNDIRITRLVPATGRRQNIVAPLGIGMEMEDQDVVHAFRTADLLPPDSIYVFGWVRNPGKYPYFDNMTAGDAILSAGGFRRGADVHIVEVVEPQPGVSGVRELTRVRLSSLEGVMDDNGAGGETLSADGVDLEGVLSDSAFLIRPEHEIFVRKSSDFDTHGHVFVMGEVLIPGRYSLLSSNDRVSGTLRRAGGITKEADSLAIHMVREGINVGISYREMNLSPGTPNDPTLISGDSIVVPAVDQTVFVHGAVNFPNRVVYRPGMNVKNMLSEAGGTAEDADLNRISVTYPDGSRRAVNKLLGMFRRYPSVRPGSTIFVPVRREMSGFDFGSALSTTLTATSTVTTVLLLIREIQRTN